MNSVELSLPQVHLQAGELYVDSLPALVSTVLGSCVSVTMFHAPTSLAAICHAMLPSPERRQIGAGERFKYLSEVIPAMAGHFHQAGISPRQVEVKVFGGGNVLVPHEPYPSERLVGSMNIQTARELLARGAFYIKAANVGGSRGRKILFNTANGAVLHRHLHPGSGPIFHEAQKNPRSHR